MEANPKHICSFLLNKSHGSRGTEIKYDTDHRFSTAVEKDCDFFFKQIIKKRDGKLFYVV